MSVPTSTVQQSHATATTQGSAVSKRKTQPTSAKDPLAALKMRAKESVMLKRSRSIRSASNDSRSGNGDMSEVALTETEEDKDVVQAESLISKNGTSNTAMPASSVQSMESLMAIREPLAKATSVELEDLLAEGRAAASLPKPTNEHMHPRPEQADTYSNLHHDCGRDASEAGEIREEGSHREKASAANDHPPTKSEPLPADEMDEVKTWLAMTGYFDKPYRDKVVSRRKRLKEIEEEKLKLLGEEQEDQRRRGQYHSTTPFPAPLPSSLPATIMLPPSSAANKTLGLRIKDSASQMRIAPDVPTPDDGASAKRNIDSDSSDFEAHHQPKMPRTTVHQRTSPRSRRVSPERHNSRSVSPRKNRKQQTPQPHMYPPRKEVGHDQSLSNREGDHRGSINRSRDEYQGRFDQRPWFSKSQPAKPDLHAGQVRFFLLKSWNYENIAMAQSQGTWVTQLKNEDLLVDAFQKNRHVIFFFSANHSKAFQGYARMQGLPGEPGVQQPSWVKKLHWPTTAPFRLKWIVKEETPYRAVGNLKNPLNENLAVFVGRDGQEIPEELGLQLCDIIDEDTAYRATSKR